MELPGSIWCGLRTLIFMEEKAKAEQIKKESAQELARENKSRHIRRRGSELQVDMNKALEEYMKQAVNQEDDMNG